MRDVVIEKKWCERRYEVEATACGKRRVENLFEGSYWLWSLPISAWLPPHNKELRLHSASFKKVAN